MTISSVVDGSNSTFVPVNSTGSVSLIGYHHPMHLSASDETGALYVGIHLVGMENYMLWTHQ